MVTWLVTGGCGFIGSCFIRTAFESDRNLRIVNLDKLTYAGHPENLPGLPEESYTFVHGGIEDAALVRQVLQQHEPDAVVHFAAESHVDRSIDGPADFVQTNVFGTVTLLEQSLQYWQSKEQPADFRFLNISTDEVYGSLGESGLFTEATAHAPNSPYAASKAAADGFARSFHRTYGLPVIITNSSNNYGPFQFPEKMIPVMILRAAQRKSLPVYGDGLQIRDWLHVEDHCRALRLVLENGRVGETYNIGGETERTNLQVVMEICELIDRVAEPSSGSARDLIEFVADRPGHDRRYAIDISKIQNELGWSPQIDFQTGLEQTIQWYLENDAWIRSVNPKDQHDQRLGTGIGD